MTSLSWVANNSTVDTYCELYSKSRSVLSDRNVSEMENMIKTYPQKFARILRTFFEPTSSVYVADSQYLSLCWTAVESLLLTNNIFTREEEDSLISFLGKDAELDEILVSVFGRAKVAVVECITRTLEKRHFVRKQLVERIKKYYFDESYYDNHLRIEQKENVPVLYYLVQRVS